MYESIYELLKNAIYTSTTLTGYQDLFLTIISSCAVLFAICVPFIVVWQVIKLIFRR